MATKHEIADTLEQLEHELARRIDQLMREGHMDQSAAECVAGICEGMASVADAMRHCNGRPSPKHSPT